MHRRDVYKGCVDSKTETVLGSNKVLSKNEKDVCLRIVVGKNSLCKGIQQNGNTGMFN